MCPHKPEGECGHINQIMTAHVACVDWACYNQPCECNKLPNFQLCAVITKY